MPIKQPCPDRFQHRRTGPFGQGAIAGILGTGAMPSRQNRAFGLRARAQASPKAAAAWCVAWPCEAPEGPSARHGLGRSPRCGGGQRRQGAIDHGVPADAALAQHLLREAALALPLGPHRAIVPPTHKSSSGIDTRSNGPVQPPAPGLRPGHDCPPRGVPWARTRIRRVPRSGWRARTASRVRARPQNRHFEKWCRLGDSNT